MASRERDLVAEGEVGEVAEVVHVWVVGEVVHGQSDGIGSGVVGGDCCRQQVFCTGADALPLKGT